MKDCRKTNRLRTCWLGGGALSLILNVGAAYQTMGQEYAVDWQTVDGGGGTIRGGVYTMSGTLGQPDAGPVMTGGSFAVQGGFWALPQAVQTPDAPALSISPAASGQALLQWTPDDGSWMLQETASLTPPDWKDAPSGSTNSIIVPATLPTKFYRLHKP